LSPKEFGTAAKELEMKPYYSRERGQALVIIALAAIGLVGIVGLAIDGSAKFSDRRHAQNAADTAALAGALTKLNSIKSGVSDLSPTSGNVETCPPPSGVLPSPVCTAIQLAALNRASLNGYDDNPLDEVQAYTCDHPDSSCGPAYAGNSNYVQVIIKSRVDTYFAKIIGVSQTVNTVHAVAYQKAGRNLAGGAMIISYDPDPDCSVGGTGGSSVEISGSATVNLTGGGIFMNSNDSCGFKIPNCADLNITGGAINTVGANNINTEGCTFDPPLTKNFNQNSVAIPADVDEIWPDVPPECGITPQQPDKLGEVYDPVDKKWHDEWLIYPGFYIDFPQPALVTNKSHIYMKEGIYCIDPPMNQDLSWSPVDAALLNGSTTPADNKYSIHNSKGVTLYIKAGGGFAINASSPTYLDATNDPASDYQGYLIILEGTHTSHPSCTINGGADIDVNGLIFAPYCDFLINGQAGETSDINAQLIGWDIKVNGANQINFNYNPSNQVKIKRKVGLMR
jgi:Putative Flp pilus-assembly TadE/G-like